MNTQDWSIIDRYIKSLPKTRSYTDYESAKRWFERRYICSCEEYTKFTSQVTKRLGI